MSKRRKAKASAPAPKHVPVIEVRRPETSEENFRLLFEMLLELHKIGGYAPLDADKAAAHTYDMLASGVVFLAYVDGNPAGCIAGVEQPFWYSQATHLQSVPLYVRAPYRNGEVGKLLLKAFADEASRRGIIGFVTIDNPDRRPKATKMSIESQLAGYVPLGFTMKVR